MAKKATEKPGTVGERGAGPNPVIRAVVTRQLLTRLEKQAKAEGHTVSSYVRHAIERAVEWSEAIEQSIARGDPRLSEDVISLLRKLLDQGLSEDESSSLRERLGLAKGQLRKRQGHGQTR
jgi:predicted DNA-binding protein